MRSYYVILMCLILLSCKSNDKEPYWLGQKEKFKLKNIQTFLIDSSLKRNYKDYPLLKNQELDSLLNEQETYLYSWQERDTSFIEFTILTWDEYRGMGLYYLVADKEDHIISTLRIAGANGEGGSKYEGYGSFISRDTLLQTSAITSFLDLKTMKNFDRPKGDTTIWKIFFTKEGQMISDKVSEKKERPVYL